MSNNFENYASQFWSFYTPPISEEVQSDWLGNIENSYEFYRSFVPLYYKILADSFDQNIQVLRKLEHHKGWVAGDPHPANFGAVLINDTHLKHSVIYTVNDPDDGFGDSAMYIDFLRFLTGIQIIGSNCNPIKKVRKAYLQGLKGKGLGGQPKEITKCLKRLRKNEKRSKKRDYRMLYDDKKNKANSTIQEISSQKLIELKVVLKNEWKDFKLNIDQGFEYIRKKGGSGGLARKVLLIQFSMRNQPARISKSRWLVVEMKGIRRPSSQYFSDLSTEKIKEAKKQSMMWQSKNKLSELYRIVKVDSNAHLREQYWLVRPRWVENPVIDPKDIGQKRQRKEVYVYQAQILGRLHHAKAINSKEYHDDAKRIKAKKWKKAAKYMANELDKIWMKRDRLINGLNQ